MVWAKRHALTLFDTSDVCGRARDAQPPTSARSSGTHGHEDASQALVDSTTAVPMLSGNLLKRFLKQAWAASQWSLRAELEERPTKAMQAAALFHEAESKVRGCRCRVPRPQTLNVCCAL